jgi:hypothetical protein
MFGKSETGQATIVAQQMHEGLYKLKAATGIYRNIWDYIADVVPDDGGETFRATFTEIFEGFDGREPSVGESAPVTFNKKKEVKFDRRALEKEFQATEEARKDQFETLADAPPGTAAAPGPGAGTDFAATMTAIAAARATGDLDEVERLKAAYRSSST